MRFHSRAAAALIAVATAAATAVEFNITLVNTNDNILYVDPFSFDPTLPFGPDNEPTYGGFSYDLLNAVLNNMEKSYRKNFDSTAYFAPNIELVELDDAEAAKDRMRTGSPALLVSTVPIVSDLLAPQTKFSPPILTSDMLVVTTKTSAEANPWKFVAPFEGPLWGVIIACIIAGSITVAIFDHFSPFGFTKTSKEGSKEAATLNTPNVIFAGIVTLLNRNPSPQKSWSVRVAWIGAYFMISFVMRSYTSSLSGQLAQRDQIIPVANFDALRTPGNTFGIVVDSWPYNYIFTSNETAVKAIIPNMRIYNETKSAVAAMRAGAVKAVISDTLEMQPVLSTPPCNLVVVSRGRQSMFYGFMYSTAYTLPSGDPWGDLMNEGVSKATDDGTVARLYSDYLLAPSVCSTGATAVTASQVDAVDFAGAVYIFLILLGLAVISMMVERAAPSWRAGGFGLKVNRWLGYFGPATAPAPAKTTPTDAAGAVPAKAPDAAQAVTVAPAPSPAGAVATASTVDVAAPKASPVTYDPQPSAATGAGNAAVGAQGAVPVVLGGDQRFDVVSPLRMPPPPAANL